ncbi:hypothetical protein [Sphingomonas humi]
MDRLRICLSRTPEQRRRDDIVVICASFITIFAPSLIAAITQGWAG